MTLLLAAALLLAPPSASISGTVLTPEGAGLPGVRVTATRAEDGAHWHALSGHRGLFRIPALEPGDYRLETDLEGALPATAEVRLGEGEARTVALQIPPSVRESITVAAAAPRDGVEVTEIRESPARDVGEAAAGLPGVWKLRKGGIANDLVVRGMAAEDLTVLLDGQRLSGACPNHMDPVAFHVDFAEVERIEIGKGPFDLRHQGSLGGVVNVVTRKPEPGWHGQAHVAAGEEAYLNPSGWASYGAASFSALGGLSLRSADAYRDGDGRRFTETANYREEARDDRAFDVATGWVRMGWVPREGQRVDVAYTRQEADTVFYPYLQMDAVYDDTDRVQAVWTAGPYRAEAAYARTDHGMTDRERVTSLVAAATRGWSMGTWALARTSSARVERRRGAWTAGFEAYDRLWDTTTELAGVDYRPQRSLPDATLSSVGVYLQAETAAGPRWTLQGGARLDRLEADSDPDPAALDLRQAFHGTRATAWSGTVPAASLRAVRRDGPLELSVGVGSTARAPEPDERAFALRRAGTDWVGNPHLDPSRHTAVDLGISRRGARLYLSASGYWGRVQDFVTLSRIPRLSGTGNPEARSYANVGAALWGGEAEAVYTVTPRLFLTGQLSAVRGSQETEPSAGVTSTALPEVPPDRAALRARWQAPRIWVEGEWLLSAAQDRVNPDLREVPTPGHAVVHLRAGGSFRHGTVSAGIANLLDRTYHEHLSTARDPFRSGGVVNEPGRSLHADLSWRF